MKLSNEDITFIQNVVNTSQLVNIDSVLIEPGCVRAMDEDKTVVLLQKENVPTFAFGPIGLTRLNTFSSRLNIIKSQEKFSIDAVVDQTEDFTRSLTMKGKGTKIDYRCAKPSTIQAPRLIQDEPRARIKLNGDAVVLLQKGQSAMDNAEEVTINCNDGVSFEFVDVNSDVFKHTFADDVESLLNEDKVRFVHRYSTKTLLALFKKNPDGFFEISRKGILSIAVNNLTVYVLPRI